MLATVGTRCRDTDTDGLLTDHVRVDDQIDQRFTEDRLDGALSKLDWLPDQRSSGTRAAHNNIRRAIDDEQKPIGLYGARYVYRLAIACGQIDSVIQDVPTFSRPPRRPPHVQSIRYGRTLIGTCLSMRLSCAGLSTAAATPPNTARRRSPTVACQSRLRRPGTLR